MNAFGFFLNLYEPTNGRKNTLYTPQLPQKTLQKNVLFKNKEIGVFTSSPYVLLGILLLWYVCRVCDDDDVGATKRYVTPFDPT